MADIRKKNDRAWLVRWREKGKQRYRQFKTQAEAEDFRRRIESEQLTRRVLANTPGIHQGGMTRLCFPPRTRRTASPGTPAG